MPRPNPNKIKEPKPISPETLAKVTEILKSQKTNDSKGNIRSACSLIQNGKMEVTPENIALTVNFMLICGVDSKMINQKTKSQNYRKKNKKAPNQKKNVPN